MKPFSRFFIGFLSCAVLVACWSEVQHSAVASSAPAGTAATSVAVPGVNLPDFSALVEKASPAVVNIEAKIGGEKAQATAQDDSQDEDQADPSLDGMPEFFRRFFGQPGGPGLPPAPQQPERRGISFGSGFIISSDGYVLTNHHVVNGASEVIVHLTDRREFKAKVIGSDESSDVAVLKVDAGNLPILKLDDSHNLKPGQWVAAIGSPFGFDHSVTVGVVSGLGRPSIDGSQRYVPFIQTDVAINRGNSGGPLLNTLGEVVGINSQIFSNSGGYMGVSFAIPIEVAMNAVRQIQKTGHVSRGQLGVQIRDVEREEMSDLGLSRAAGAFVAVVQNGSAAAKAGIRPGDVIVAFNGKDIGSSSDLPPLVGAMAPGSRASLKVLRNGKSMDVPVVLATLDESTASSNAAPGKAPAIAKSNSLGVVVGNLDAGTRGKLGLGANEGVKISQVTGMAARQAGLTAGDVILQVGKVAVGNTAQFEAAVKALKSGDRVRLLIRNADSTGLVTVVVS